MHAKQFFQMMKMTTTILVNQINELNLIVEDLESRKRHLEINGNEQEQRVSFGVMLKIEVKSNLSNRLGMILTSFLILSRHQMSKQLLEMILKEQTSVKSLIFHLSKLYWEQL